MTILFQVITNKAEGMMFRNKRDRKIMNVDPYQKSYGENSTRTLVPAKDYLSVIIYDHYNRTKC